MEEETLSIHHHERGGESNIYSGRQILEKVSYLCSCFTLRFLSLQCLVFLL